MKKLSFTIAFVGFIAFGALTNVSAQLNSGEVVLNEIVIAPPGIDSVSGCEYVELRGLPNMIIGDFTFADVEGDIEQNPGTVNYLRSLQNLSTGADGLLVIASSSVCRQFDSRSAVLLDPTFQSSFSISNNGTNSFLIYRGQLRYQRGQDLDADNNGTEDGEAVLFDGISVVDGNDARNDVQYSLALLNRRHFTPINEAVNAATRFCGNLNRNSADAFYYGDLESTANTTNYSSRTGSRSLNFPPNGQLTPGATNAPDPPPPTLVISGQLVNRNGRGVGKANLTMICSNGAVKVGINNPFGFFKFTNISNDSICTVSIRHKKYYFPDQTFNVLESDQTSTILAQP